MITGMFARSAALLLLLLTVSCSRSRPAELPPAPIESPAIDPVNTSATSTGAGPVRLPNAWLVHVSFATDRAPVPTTGSDIAFTGYRGALKLGHALVSVPRVHVAGRIEAPSWWRLEFEPDPTKHFAVRDMRLQEAQDWVRDLRERVARSPDGNMLLFVHGYNVTFDDALKRTAQIGFDTGVTGPIVLFSWPSRGSTAGYLADEDSVRWATSDLIRTLRTSLAGSGARQVFLVAHSMGNRALVDALVELGRRDPALRSRIREVVLAAPDVDASLFKRDLAPRLAAAAQHVTLYASSRDWALAASRTVHDDLRAGETEPSVTVATPIETIDVSTLGADFLGHSYVGSSESVLSDMRALFAYHGSAPLRGMVPMSTAAGRYWRFPRR